MIKGLYEYYLRNIRHKGKRHAVKWSLAILPFKTLKTHYGPVFKVNRNDKTNIYALCGEYGHIVAGHVEALPKGSAFIDIGTNYGLFSLMASKSVGTEGRVYSFEPNPFIYSSFIENVRLSNATNIIPFQSAIAEKNGILNLSFEQGHSGKSHIVDSRTVEAIKISGFNISEWTFLEKDIAGRPVHIKIDVEGYEAKILDVLLKCSWFENVKSITIEIDQENLNIFDSDAEKDIYERLQREGFSTQIGLDKSQHYDEIFTR
ncbi:MAG: FkbM family methyltransferase [Alphaproteobacteria bacterium]